MNLIKRLFGVLITAGFSAMLSAEVVWVAHCRDRDPLIIIESDGCSGPGADVISLAIAQMEGHRVEWISVPWARTITVAQFGQVDLIPLHSMDSEREAFLDPISIGYGERMVYFFKLADNPIVVNRFEDLYRRSIGALRGSFYTENVNQHLDDFNVTYVTSTEQMLTMLKAGRFDLAITSEQHGLDVYEHDERLVPVAYRDTALNGRFFSVPRQSPNHQYVGELRKIVDAMVQSGEITAIFESYGVEAPVQAGK